MATWQEFEQQAPHISALFRRRHAATGNLCFLGTLMKDGSPRISPMEPWMFEGQLWLVGMPGTTKFADLARDPRFTLHTASADPKVTEGDAKLSGTVHNVDDPEQQKRWLQDMFERTGHDFRGEVFEQFLAADITSASSVEVADDHLDITVWKDGRPEYVVRKH
ncbi:MAG: pyridoxamine 5'-phosphate oxidase family protein [Nocardiaceae bacterium]|nr:pyridoxamine 5'-phosphate oxidase family protein [Nocardiaceae bacterium]